MDSRDDMSFREQLRQDLRIFVEEQQQRFPRDETLSIDLHCHDENSSVPDELLGRILNWPETWVTTDELLAALAHNGATAFTITNHNNARSCYALLERGIDVLVGAEFTCMVPDFGIHVHVLTYGFTPAQEARLAALRRDLYRFLDYTRAEDLVTVLAHPLFYHGLERVPPLAFLEKLTLLFDNFEALNGHRDTWQNLLVASWLRSLNAERIAEMAKRAGIAADAYCRRPVDKVMTGGSDDHMALFVGTAGSLVHIPRLGERLRVEKRSALVLGALRAGRVAPFGTYTGEEKLAASFLDYFCQVSMNAGDPGLIRMLLHRGSVQQKAWAFLIANAMFEIRRHRATSAFVKAAHEALHGKKLGFWKRRFFSKTYRPLLRELDQIAIMRSEHASHLEQQLRTSIPAIFHELNVILAERIRDKVERHERGHRGEAPLGPQDLVARLEVPANLRALVGASEKTGSAARRISQINLEAWSEGLPFPALAALVIGGSTYASSKVLFTNRRLLEEFSQAIGRYRHPRRLLWLTDAFFDHSGVASVLRLMHDEVVRRDLPIDFAIAHAEASPDAHLKVLRPIAEFALPYYKQQPIRLFDIMELSRLFIDGGYDRVICSTEAPMGLAGLYLKNAFSVPAFFYMHTDWIDFAKRTLGLDRHNTDRVRRALRTFYRSFDGLFVLNSEHREWLSSDAMGIARGRIQQTAHWIDARFGARHVAKAEVFPGVREDEPVILFVGRVSDEKGVMEFPEILSAVRKEVPRARMVIVGSGPAEERLKAALPDAVFIPWVDTERLARIYPAADAMLLPSRFDTFGCVVLEALASGLPVVAYRSKGPRDIIQHGVCGFTEEDPAGLVAALMRILADSGLHEQLRAGAIERARAYRADRIVGDMLEALGLGFDTEHAFRGEPAPSSEEEDQEDEDVRGESVSR